ncbi:MAG: hypothetical protein Q8R15_03970 [Candidatus Micrarchaeota archaeon]|nr:hypothetical protein [Candidatus Micrarchaeota archaeon]
MVYSVSDAVKEVLEELTFLHHSMDYNLLNYSAVARFIHPAVSTKLGGGTKPSLEAVAVAVRRYIESSGKGKKSLKLLDVVRSCKIILRTDLCMLNVRQWLDVNFLKEMEGIIPEVDFRAGEKLYMVTRSNDLIIMCNSRFMSTIESKVNPPAKLTEKKADLALITINIQQADFDVPGVLQFFVQQFEMAGINIHDLFSTRGKITFLFAQRDAARAYERISAAIEAVKAIPFS